MDLLTEMLEHVAKSQRNKLKLEKLSMPSQDKWVTLISLD